MIFQSPAYLYVLQIRYILLKDYFVNLAYEWPIFSR